jgi:hypothetical protein
MTWFHSQVVTPVAHSNPSFGPRRRHRDEGARLRRPRLPRSRTRIALAHSHSWEFWGRPTGKVVIGLALVIIEFLRRSPERAADASATQT